MKISMWWIGVVGCAGGLACGSVSASQVDAGGGSGSSIDAPGGGPMIDGSIGPSDGPNIDAMPGDEFASCVGLPATCGNGGNESCCTSPLVPGGSFGRGFDLAGDVHSGANSHPATVSTFRLDRYEVTVGRFRAFVNASMGTQTHPPGNRAGGHPNLVGSGWDPNWNPNLPTDTTALIAQLGCDATLQTWTPQAVDNELRPMNCVSWYEAMAFCIWDGGYLPTEAEWNFAAAGGDQQRAYPWSNPASTTMIDGSHASYFDGNDCVGDGMPDCAVTDLVPVGNKFMGNGRWGHSDLGGNVAEWTLDWLAAYATPCTDCANLTASVNHVLRGGSFNNNDDDARTGSRIGLTPGDHNNTTGVRCARTP